MRIGLDEWSIHHLDISAYDKLDLVESFGLEGIQFADARALSRNFDLGEIREVAAEAKRRNLYLEMGIPGLNFLRPSAKALEAGQGDYMNGLRRMLEAAAATGTTVIRTFVGGPGDRLRPDAEWQLQQRGAIQIAQSLAPLARELGVYLAFETHADVTSFELLRLIEEVGDDVAKVILDTGNFPIVLEDPLAATRRLAPHIIATHMKDCITILTEQGISSQCRPLGTGIVPLADILAVLHPLHPDLNLSIEDHEGIYRMDIFKAGWERNYLDIQANDLAWLIEQARLSEVRIESGEIFGMDALEEIPWADQADERIRTGAANLKRILGEVTA
jgi:sugar phosphate isomerase/epimerase